MPKRILITGGAGFIGSYLCERLLAEGHEVLCLDNYFTGSKTNIAHLRDNPRFEAIRHDIVHPIYLEVEQIYNLACPASPVHYQYNAIKTVKTSVLGTMNMLGVAKRTGATLLQASTSEVYGDPVEHPQKETYWGHVNPIGIRSCYDEGKRVAETLLMDYHRQHRVKVKIVRIFNTYGPRMQPDDGRVVSNFIIQALRNQPLTIHGDGRQTRAFCYVDDLVEGMVRMMAKPGFIGPVNLGNPGAVPILRLAEMVLAQTGSRSELRFLPRPADDPVQRDPDISLARAELGWAPSVSLERGLGPTIAYFDRLLGAGEGKAP